MTTDDDGSPEADWSGSQPPEATDDLPTDTAFDVLAHHRRRYALQYLRSYGSRMSLADLADEIAVREHEVPIKDIPAETVKRIYLSLYHRHIPKLEDAGVVTYSQQRDAVALTEQASELMPHLEVADD